MPYLIDGHNVIAQLPDVSLDDPDDEAKLVLKLKGFVARKGNRCIVVFDHGIPGGVSKMGTSKITVIFAAAERSNADRVLMGRIRKMRNPSGWIVVSSDREVRDVAQQHRMATLTADEFILRLQSPKRQQPDAGEAVHVHVPDEDVEHWLTKFGDE